MGFDIPQIHLLDNSLEARVIEAIVRRDRISPEEVVRRALRGMAIEESALPPANPRDILGAFSSPEERAVMDDALELAMNDRQRRNAQPPHA